MVRYHDAVKGVIGLGAVKGVIWTVEDCPRLEFIQFYRHEVESAYLCKFGMDPSSNREFHTPIKVVSAPVPPPRDPAPGLRLGAIER